MYTKESSFVLLWYLVTKLFVKMKLSVFLNKWNKETHIVFCYLFEFLKYIILYNYIQI